MREPFAVFIGFVWGFLLAAVLSFLLVVHLQREIRKAEHEMAVQCEDARARAQKLGTERNELWQEIDRLKRIIQ